MLKTLAVVIATSLIFVACAQALLTPRAFQERRYRPCYPDEVSAGEVSTGKFCHRYCAKYKFLRADTSENCDLWKTDVKDVTKESDFLEFRAAGFVLINEQRIK